MRWGDRRSSEEEEEEVDFQTYEEEVSFVIDLGSSEVSHGVGLESLGRI